MNGGLSNCITVTVHYIYGGVLFMAKKYYSCGCVLHLRLSLHLYVIKVFVFIFNLALHCYRFDQRLPDEAAAVLTSH